MNPIIKRALTTGIILIIWLFGAFSILSALPLNIPLSVLRTLTGILGLVILFLGILTAMKTAKKNTVGEFGYFKAFKTGFFVALIVAVIIALVSFLYVKLINPNLANDMVREAEVYLKKSNDTPEKISQTVHSIRQEYSPGAQLIAPLVVQTAAGTVFSLILAFFIRKK